MPDEHDSLLHDWRQNSAKDAERSFRFVRSLKMVDDPDEVDAVAGELHEEAFRKIDCLRCANCCKTMRPQLTAEDIERIAGHLGMNEQAFKDAYLEADPDEGGVRMKALPCPFLGTDNRCTIYAVRPVDCRDFPHTQKEGFIWRTYGHARNTENCPAVYYIVKRMRRHLGRRR